MSMMAERRAGPAGKPCGWVWAAWLALACATAPTEALAARDPSQICVDAAAEGARRSGVPFDVMLAVTLTETGRPMDGVLRPWPWAMNLAGESLWLDSAEEALLAAEDAVARGQGNFDLGCFQINHRWHGENFASLDAMIDPATNAAYAADFLAELYSQTGSWPDAVATYHSRTPEFAERYRERFTAIYASLSEGSIPADAPPRPNSFPLLQAGTPSTPGSLVPLSATARPLIGG